MPGNWRTTSTLPSHLYVPGPTCSSVPSLTCLTVSPTTMCDSNLSASSNSADILFYTSTDTCEDGKCSLPKALTPHAGTHGRSSAPPFERRAVVDSSHSSHNITRQAAAASRLIPYTDAVVPLRRDDTKCGEIFSHSRWRCVVL